MTIAMNRETCKVFIQGSCFAGSIRGMLAAYGGPTKFKQAKTVAEADMILYTGGADISPQLYGEPTLYGTSVSHEQDKKDLLTYREGLRLDKYHVGICRGAQLLAVLNGGKLWQDVNKHAGPNHEVIDVLSRKRYEVSSLHHQGIVLNKETSELLAWTDIATNKTGSGIAWYKSYDTGTSVDVEAFWCPKTRSLGVQWHPEIGPDTCVEWFFHYLETYKNVREDTIKDEVERQVG